MEVIAMYYLGSVIHIEKRFFVKYWGGLIVNPLFLKALHSFF